MNKNIENFCENIENENLRQFFIDILERAEEEKDFKNLRKARDFIKEENVKIVKPAIMYGTLLRARTDRLFEVKGKDGDLLGVYRMEKDAKNKANKKGRSYRSIDVETSISCREFLEELKVKNSEVSELLSKAGGFITSENTITDYRKLKNKKFEIMNDEKEEIAILSIVFGYLLENTYPDICILIDNNGIKRAVHSKKEDVNTELQLYHIREDGKKLRN